MSTSFISAATQRATDSSRPRAKFTRPRPPRVLCYGDSLTAGLTALTEYTGTFSPWAPPLADALGMSLDHVGMCGWTTAQMLDGLDGEDNMDVCQKSHCGLRKLLVESNPGYTHVLLMAGTNDLNKVRSAERIAESLQQLHATCHAAGARTLALGIPHSKSTTVGSSSRCERRREVNERLQAFAARSGGWCEFCEPGSQVMRWEAGSSYFERDGLHMTRSGYALFAALLLRDNTLREFLQRHHAFVPTLSKLSEEEVAWRRRLREWTVQYQTAVDVVQEAVFDVHMAKASREELEALHSVLQADGLAGLEAAVEALELKALDRAFAEGGEEGRRAAEKAAKRARRAAAKARHRGEAPAAADIAKLAQAAFVPLAGRDLQQAAQPLRVPPATLYARLNAWRSAEEDRAPFGEVEFKDAIECFVDSCFTVFTVDNTTYHPMPVRPPTMLLSERRSERVSERFSYVGSGSDSGEEEESDGEEGHVDDHNGEGEGESEEEEEESDAVRAMPGSRTLRAPWWARDVAVPWLSLPSPQLTSFAVVHRGPLSGGHLKLYLRAAGGGGGNGGNGCSGGDGDGGGGTLFVVDVLKKASSLQDHDWGDAAPLIDAPFAYPRSGTMYPTIFRFMPARDGEGAGGEKQPVEVPDFAPTSASDLRVSERGNVLAGSGWFALREELSVAAALSSFVELASRRWTHVELYNCRSFVRELAELLAAEEASVDEAFDNVFRFVVLEREAHGDRVRG